MPDPRQPKADRPDSITEELFGTVLDVIDGGSIFLLLVTPAPGLWIR